MAMKTRGYPKTVRLRDGTEVQLRPMVPEDRDALLAFFQRLPEEDRMFLKEDVTKPELIDRWAKNLDYDRVLPILALKGDQVVGDGTLHMDRFGWMRHVGEIRIVVAHEYQGQGLGRLIALELVWNAQRLGLDKIQVQVAADAAGALEMFQKLGFQPEAELKDQILDLKGHKHNLIIMVNNVADLWRQMEDLIQDSQPAGTRWRT